MKTNIIWKFKKQNEKEEVCKKEDKYDEEFYYKILNKKRYILLYDEINNLSAESVCAKLRAMDSLNKREPIWLEINSGGGSVTDGLAIIDTIANITAPVYTIINGSAASMAAMISIVGAKRYMTSHATFMQHSMSDCLGDYLNHIKDRTAFLSKLEDQMTSIMKKKTKLNKTQYAQIRNGELWLFAKEALRAGVVDKILK